MNKYPWLAHYDEGVPHTLKPYPERTLLDVVSDAAKQYPDSPILYFKGNSISYGELERLSNALAAALIQLGVQKGDRVVLLMPNFVHRVFSALAASIALSIALNEMDVPGVCVSLAAPCSSPHRQLTVDIN